MKTIMDGYLYDIKMGDIQEYKNLAVQPLFSAKPSRTDYNSLNEGMRAGWITITELPNGPSVSQVQVINRGKQPIMLLHGEEVAGAQQNRVFNTTILISESCETVVPVSCTESGRWSPVSEKFYDSHAMMPSYQRSKMATGVSSSLRFAQTYDSDQGQVWDDIRDFANRANVGSSTGAMRDVYTAREGDISEYIDAFEITPGQNGMVLFVNGKVRALEMMSRERVYSGYHNKLLESYAVEAITIESKKIEKPLAYESEIFLRNATSWSQQKYPSPGIGEDYRFEDSKDSNKNGSALVYQDELIHMALFDQSE